MKMPMLDQPKRRAETVSVFGGYDARDRRGTEGFSEVENLSSSAYPALSPRSRRGERAGYADELRFSTSEKPSVPRRSRAS